MVEHSLDGFGLYTETVAGSRPASSTNAEGRAEANPVSRQNHLLRSLARWRAKAHPKEKFMKKMGEARVNHQTETAAK